MESKSTDQSVNFVKKLLEGCCILCIGQKGSGKSATCLALLRTCLERKTYQELHLVIPNYLHEANASYEWIKEFHNKSGIQIFIYSEYDTLICKKILNQKNQIKEFCFLWMMPPHHPYFTSIMINP